MMGERRAMQESLFYGFSLDRHVPNDRQLRKIDCFVDLSGVRAHLEPFSSEIGRPLIDPELMIRLLIVGYCFGVRAERRRPSRPFDLLEEPPRPFSRERPSVQAGRDGVARCIKERLVGGEASAVDASMIVADAHRRRGDAERARSRSMT
jgi:hypothetical protein